MSETGKVAGKLNWIGLSGNIFYNLSTLQRASQKRATKICTKILKCLITFVQVDGNSNKDLSRK